MVFISAHIGAATSPFLVQLTRINAVLPFAVMGALSVIGAILCWTLPETLGRKTAEVWEDAEDSKGTMVLLFYSLYTKVAIMTIKYQQIR